MDMIATYYKAESVYNQLAEMIAHLKKIAPEFCADPEKRKSSVFSREQKAELGLFFKEHPELNDPRAMFLDGFSPKLKESICQWKYYNDAIFFYNLLLRFERELDIEDVLGTIKEKPFVSLNSNWEMTDIYILPRVRSIHDSLDPAGEEDRQKHWSTDWNAGINQDLKSIFYVERQELRLRGKEYKIRNVVLSSALFESKNYFRIAVSPIVSDAELDVHYYEEEDRGVKGLRFSVHGLKNVERVHRRIEAAFLEACRKDADVAVFPEMLGDEELLEPTGQFSPMIDSMIEKAEKEGHVAPYLTLMPTWWHDGRNELYVISDKGERLCIQQKQKPFNLKKDGVEYTEALTYTKPEVQIVHIDGIGRITFPICKDLLVPDYSDMLISVLRSTFAICPSFSPKKTQFDLGAAKGTPYGCYIIWLNTCSAMEDVETRDKSMDHIGWFSCPLVEDSLQKLCPNCSGDCGNDSDVCLFIVQVSLDRDSPRAIVGDHIHVQSP